MANSMKLLISNVLSKSHIFSKSNFRGRAFYCTTNQPEEVINDDDELGYSEEEIKKIRNKSLLNEEHYDTLHGKVSFFIFLYL